MLDNLFIFPIVAYISLYCFLICVCELLHRLLGESALISVSPNQEVALVAARVVAYLGAWIAILRPPVLSAELFLAPHAEIQWRLHKYGSCGIITDYNGGA